MDRGASASVVTEIGAAKNQPIHLIKFSFDDGDVCLTDAYRDIAWNGDTYQATGHFLNMSDIEESSELQVDSVSIMLSGVDQSWIGTLLTKNYIDRQVKIYLAFLNTSENVVSNPVLIFDGRMDAPVIADNPDDGTCEITVGVASQFVDFNKVAGRLTNHEDQQIYFPGDKGFEFASEVVKEIIWGRLNTVSTPDNNPYQDPGGTHIYTDPSGNPFFPPYPY